MRQVSRNNDIDELSGVSLILGGRARNPRDKSASM